MNALIEIFEKQIAATDVKFVRSILSHENILGQHKSDVPFCKGKCKFG